jgi:hypothetical protein
MLLIGVAASRVNSQNEVPSESLVSSLRILNTAEAEYMKENGRFVGREEILNHLRNKGWLKRAAIDLDNPKPYELAITLSPDAKHYQIALKRTSDMNDKGTWCKAAAFTDDAAVIYLGSAIGCEASTR